MVIDQFSSNLHEEEGVSALESIALLATVALLLIAILNAFQHGYTDGKGNWQEAGKIFVQRAMDSSLERQMSEYDKQRHSFSLMGLVSTLMSLSEQFGSDQSGTGKSGSGQSGFDPMGDGQLQDGESGLDLPGFDQLGQSGTDQFGSEVDISKIEKILQARQELQSFDWKDAQNLQQDRKDCEDCTELTSEMLCSSQNPELMLVRQRLSGTQFGCS